MTPLSGLTTRAAAAGACCVIATVAYSGAVTLTALLAFLLPAVLVAAVVAGGLARLSRRLATGSGLCAALVLAEIVNLVSGSAQGPAARSTFAAAACTVVAVVLASGPVPALFPAAVAAVIVGALGLGAGAEVVPVAAATALATVISLAVVESQGRRWTRRSLHLPTVILFAVLVGAVAMAVGQQAARNLDGEPAVLMPQAVQPSIRPPQVLEGQTPARSTSSSHRATEDNPPTSEPPVRLRTIWLGVLAIILLALLYLVLRLVWIALSWRLLRRRLRTGSTLDQIAGAWIWSTRRLRVAGWPVPASLSADAVSAGQGTDDLPRSVRVALRQVAEPTVAAIFAPPEAGHDPVSAWAAADEASRCAVRSLSTAQRLGFALRPLSSVPSRTAASAPTIHEGSLQ